MGDIIETRVAAFQPCFYYKISDNGTWFDIKTHSKVLIGLAEESSGGCRYWLDIRNPGIIRILEGSDVRKSKSGLGFTLTEDRDSRFWIAWDSKHLWAGVGNRGRAVIVCPIFYMLNYITFATKDTLHPCSIKFAVPPLSLTTPLVRSEPKITTGKLQWKPCENQLPDEAVIGGYIDGEIVYVVRAHHRQSLTPGVFVPSKGLAFIPWGGSDNPTSDFEALCGFNLIWKPASADRIPVDAFVAGYSEDRRHEPLYIGRALFESNKIPGKVQLSHRVCYIAFQEKEIAIKNFEVLTEPGLNVSCANKCVGPMSDVVNIHHHNEYDDGDMSDDDDEDLHHDVVIF